MESRLPAGSRRRDRLCRPKRQTKKATSQVASIVDMIGIMPVGTDISAKDRFRVNGIVFEVIGTDKGRSSATLLTAQIKRVA